MSGNLRKFLAATLALTLVASLVVGCSPESEPTTPADDGDKAVSGGTMSYQLGSEPTAIDPYDVQESEGTEVGQAVFDSLTVIDPETGKVAPAAAESWEPNDDGSVWTFKLREGATFHDGTPVKASDFVYAWNRIATSPVKNPKDPSDISYHLGVVKGYDEAQKSGTDMVGLKAVDDNTLEVTLAYAFGDFDFVAAHPALAPVPKALVEGGVEYNGEKVAFSDMPVGNGPFKMSEPWKHDQYVKVVRNDDYYGDKPYLDGVEFKIFKDEETAYREFQAGTLDFTDIPEGQIEGAKTQFGVSDDGYTVQPGKGVLLGAETAIYYITLNTTDPTLKNQKVREAISLAINRQAIADTLYEGTRQPASSISPPGLPGHANDSFPSSKYDVEAAKKALADAGFPEGKGIPSLKINYNTGSGHEKVMELVQSDLKKIGITTTFEGLEFPQHIEKMQAGTYQIGRAGWIADYPIMDNFLYPLFQSESADNWSKYKNADIDKALLEARSTTDPTERANKYQEIEKTIGSLTPVVPIVYYAHRQVGSDRLNDFIYDNQGLGHFEKAWLTDGGKTE